ncbi:MAG: hypothetical protein Fur0022_26120 [Anaerolineales bacterium]
MSKNTTLKHSIFSTLTFFLILTTLSACQRTPTPFIPPGNITLQPGETPAVPTEPSPPPTPTPTNTPIPLALTVNSEAITLAEYEASLARLLAAQPDLPPEEARTRVLDELTDQLLLSQAATQAGFVVDAPTLDAHIQALAEQIGGADALHTWLAANFYTEELFQLELRRSLAAAWMRDQIAAGVPTVAEQVHVRQLLLFSASEANEVYAQLQGGVPFDLMVSYYDPVSLGDLGWFPRGYLFETAIEEMAFSQEIGAYSPVIETRIGFHIIQTLDRQPDRPLDPEVLRALQEKALRQWVEQQRATASITVLIP